jgi:hypothetical protein
MPEQTLSPTLDQVLAAEVPRLLFHYTSSQGLIGILRTQELWASNVAFFNDVQEVEHAVNHALIAIENTIARGVSRTELVALEEMREYVGSAAKRYYVLCLSEERDLLSQWRAYSPPGGGYSIGFPSKQLLLMADIQGFTLAPCVYDEQLKYRIAQEFVDTFLSRFRAAVASGSVVEQIARQIALEFGMHVTKFGITLKHSAFREEKEWRLISPMISEPHAQLDYRPSSVRVVPFFRFRLTDNQHPNLTAAGDDHLTVIVGPTSDPLASAMAVQFLLRSTVGTGAFHGVSEVPYRTW